MSREDNVAVYLDTKAKCETDPTLAGYIKESNRKQCMIAETDVVEETEPAYSEPAKIVVSKKRSFEAAQPYVKQGYRVGVHNFASATNAGGGVEKGSSAQEECLCRCSTLHANLKRFQAEFYAAHRSALQYGQMNSLYNDDCIFTPEVCVFKTDTALPQLMKKDDWYLVDVITCAAPNLREKPSNAMNPGSGNQSVKISDRDLMELHVKRASRILDIACAKGDEVVILGAFGCGAFQNPPTVVAGAMKEVVQRYRNKFRVIEFAVYCSPADTKNYDVFKAVL